MTDPIAELRAVEVDYARGPALGPFSLALEPGEIVALVGPSGCGKSTALRLLAGLEGPTRGEVRRASMPGQTAVVFQAPTLMPWATALDNVALPLALAGVAKTEARSRAASALARVKLAGVDDAKPAQLSGGMAMRVSLARALVTDPRVLLLDEPFAALVYMASRTIVMSAGPGRAAGETRLDAPLPRPEGFRTTPEFRHAAEAVSTALGRAMARPA